jgi:hypothetical protein
VGGLTSVDLWRGGEVHAEPGDDPVPRTLKQDAATLASPSIRSLGHLRLSARPGSATSAASINASPATRASAGAGGSPLRKLDDGRAEEVSVESLPHPVVTATSGILAECDKPVTLDCKRVGKQCAVRRTKPFDNPDPAQKSDPAALSVSWPSGPISR